MIPDPLILDSSLTRELESACRKALYRFEMIDGVAKVAIALSGGKDSLSLLYLLHRMRGRGFDPFELIAIHVGGQFSCGAGVETKFLKSVCDKLEIPLIVKESTKKARRTRML